MDPFLPPLPPQLWKRGRRSRRGGFVRFWTGGSFVLVGLTAMPSIFGIGLVVFGVLFTVLFPSLVELLVLRRWEKRVAASVSGTANRALADLGEARAVQWFAPAPWIAITQALLHARRGDTRASALAYADAHRVSPATERSRLRSAQAEMLLRAADRRGALSVLEELEREDLLADRDAANYGIALLQEGGKAKAAAAQLDRAREGMGGHGRVLAAWALAHQKIGDREAAREAYEAAAALEDDHDDPLVPELLKRAKKATRTSADKRKPERKTAEAKPKRTEPAAKAKTKPKPRRKPKQGSGAGGKKARKQARREARKEAKAQERRERQAREQAFTQAERERSTRELERKVKRDRERAKREAAAHKARAIVPKGPGGPKTGSLVPPAPRVGLAPSTRAPVVRAPVVTAPVVTAPVVSAPAVSAPVVTAPAVSAPAVSAPAFSAPAVSAPAVSAPVVSPPPVSGIAPSPPRIAPPRAPSVAPPGLRPSPSASPAPPLVPPASPTPSDGTPPEAPAVAGASDRLGLRGIAPAPKPSGGFVPSFGPPPVTPTVVEDADAEPKPPPSLQAFLDGLGPKKK